MGRRHHLAGRAVCQLSVRGGFRAVPFLCQDWAHEAQHLHRETLFGWAPFDEMQFDFGQPRFEHVLIPINIALVSA